MMNRKMVMTVLPLAAAMLVAPAACRKEEPEARSPTPATKPTVLERETPVPTTSEREARPQTDPGARPPSSPPVITSATPSARTEPDPQQGAAPRAPVVTPIPVPDGVDAPGGFAVHPVSDDPVDQAIDRLLPYWNTIQSLSAKVKVEFDRLDEQETHIRGEGTRDWLKKNGEVLTLVKIFNQVQYKGDDGTLYVTGQRLTMFADDQYLFTIDERNQGTAVTKEYAVHAKIPQVGGPRLFAAIRRLENLQVDRNRELDGERVVVFEGSFRNGKSHARHWLDAENGLLRKMEIEHEEAKSTFTYTLSDFTFNVEFPEDHFEFNPPEGLEVQDLTQRRPGPPQSAPGP